MIGELQAYKVVSKTGEIFFFSARTLIEQFAHPSRIKLIASIDLQEVQKVLKNLNTFLNGCIYCNFSTLVS